MITEAWPGAAAAVARTAAAFGALIDSGWTVPLPGSGATAERCADEVLATVGRSLGAAPLAHDGGHAQRVADLAVYARQHHGERDLAALGELLHAAGEDSS